jgi:predicted  nucleic acid-binding Zn-ribbon protein
LVLLFNLLDLADQFLCFGYHGADPSRSNGIFLDAIYAGVTNYPVGLDTIRQKPEIERLQDQLARQKSEWNTLRFQRVDISAQLLNNSQTIQALAERAKEELQSTAVDTQEEIFSLRSEIDRLQGVQSQFQSQLRALGLQIYSVQKSFEDQLAKVRSLENSIQVKKAESRSEYETH